MQGRSALLIRRAASQSNFFIKGSSSSTTKKTSSKSGVVYDHPARRGRSSFSRSASSSSSASSSESNTDMKFTITYSKNWDGGGQEFEAAKAAILAVVKNANVVPNRVDKYPITVTIEEEQLGMIYSGRQQGFFGKNGRPAMREVEEALRSKL